MKRKLMHRGFLLLLAAGLVAGTQTGCEDGGLWAIWGATQVRDFISPHLRDMFTTETVCYRNGEPIDCSEMP